MTDRDRDRNKDRDKDLAWEEIRVEHVVQDQWIDFRKSAFRYPDGRIFEPFYSYSRKDYVVIVASDVDGQYLCVRQFRQGIKEVTTEFPAGGVERTDGKEYRGAGADETSAAEELLETAKRELMEETGYESDEWEHLLTVPSNATIADNYATVFRAKNCRLVAGQDLDETEVLNIYKYSADEIESMIYNGQFQQSVHVMAWLLAKEKERNTK
jgi:ADP-ribose pyrophosphatase